MTRRTENYPFQRDEENPLVEKLGWTSNSELSHRVLEQIQNDHPELMEELADHARNHTNHTQVSWVTQTHQPEKYEGANLDPESTAGKIFT